MLAAMNQKPAHPFAVLARDVLPEQTSGRLARMFDVNQRIAQRWISGDLEPPPDVWAKLQRQQELLKDHHPGVAMAQIIVQAQQAGIETEVLGAFLSEVYEFVTKRKIQ